MSQISGADGTPLTLHFWRPTAPSAALALLYYVHGIQSHAGWLFETGPELAREGVVTCVLDRRGSGRSGGLRGHLPSARMIVEDYLGGFRVARQAYPDLPVTVLGQSFGGSIVAALAAGGELAADRLVYCAPALGQQRARHGVEGLAKLRRMAGPEPEPIDLEDEGYTDQSRYLEFMANDPLMVRQLTRGSRATMVELEQGYLGRRAPGERPVHLVRAAHDPIIAIEESERVLHELHPSFRTVTLPIHRHYVEFSPMRREYWNWLTQTVLPGWHR